MAYASSYYVRYPESEEESDDDYYERYPESEEESDEMDDERDAESEEDNESYEIITPRDIGRCQEVMTEIMNERRPVAIDAEGVSLGAKGRMTLLQICTWAGEVYLIDLIEPDDPYNTWYGEKLMEEGLVEDMLTSSCNEKVIHACANDSAALYHQFDIRLDPKHVLDLQVASMALQRVTNEKVFLKKRRLNELAQIYNTPEHPVKDDHLEWMKSDYKLWEKRPLTEQMIQYAVHDVRGLIPELYNAVRQRLADNAHIAWPTYREMVGWEIDQQIEGKRVSAERRESLYNAAMNLLSSMDNRYHGYTALHRLNNEEKGVLRMLNKHWGHLSQVITQKIEKLEERVLLSDIDELVARMTQNAARFRLTGPELTKLQSLCQHQNDTVHQAAYGFFQGLAPWQKKPVRGRRRR